MGRRLFEEPADCRALLPAELSVPVTTEDMAEAMGTKRPLAQKMAYSFRKAGVIRPSGKRGRAHLYEIAP